MERCLVLWYPDWPVTALIRSRQLRIDDHDPVAIIANNHVVACSASARADGVRRGMRRRDAQSRSPRLRLAPEDIARDAREFMPIVDRIERFSPGLQLLRPGLCALRIKGPARYYGGELPAALALLGLLESEGIGGARAGIADGRFAAEQAARAAEHALVIPEQGSAAFLSPLPVRVLGDDRLAELLEQLGIRTLGDFAALDARDVLDRFGPSGAMLHTLAAGEDSRRIEPRIVPPEHSREVSFEPPVMLAEQVAFGVRVTADHFAEGLASTGLVCTELRVELTGAEGESLERVWAHPASFDAAAIVDRVRWQLEGALSAGGGLRGGVTQVRLIPEAVGSISAHEPGLFGRGVDERVAHALSRVQAMLGHRGVMTASIGGGRRLAERIIWTPWGDRPPPTPREQRPWPGALPAPHPSTVYQRPIPVGVEGERGQAIHVDERDTLSCDPAWILAGGRRRRITAWAGPWPLIERGWDPREVRRAHRFQAVDAAGGAWALILEDGDWSVEGRYD